MNDNRIQEDLVWWDLFLGHGRPGIPRLAPGEYSRILQVREVNRGWNEPRHQYEHAQKRMASIEDANPPNEQNTCFTAMVSASARPLNDLRLSCASGLCLLSGSSQNPALQEGRRFITKRMLRVPSRAPQKPQSRRISWSAQTWQQPLEGNIQVIAEPKKVIYTPRCCHNRAFIVEQKILVPIVICLTFLKHFNLINEPKRLL